MAEHQSWTSKEIGPDDIEVGAYVTVLKGPTRERVVGGGIFDSGPSTVVAQEDRSYKGEVLKVEAMSFPYVSVIPLTGISATISKTPRSIDLRETSLARLSEEYVKSMLSGRKR